MTIRIVIAIVWFVGFFAFSKWVLGIGKGDDVGLTITGLIAVFGISALFPGYFYRGEPFRPKR